MCIYIYIYRSALTGIIIVNNVSNNNKTNKYNSCRQSSRL